MGEVNKRLLVLALPLSTLVVTGCIGGGGDAGTMSTGVAESGSGGGPATLSGEPFSVSDIDSHRRGRQ